MVEEFGASLICRDSTYKTPLMYASSEGQVCACAAFPPSRLCVNQCVCAQLAAVEYILHANPLCVDYHKTNSWTPLMVPVPCPPPLSPCCAC